MTSFNIRNLKNKISLISLQVLILCPVQTIEIFQVPGQMNKTDLIFLFKGISQS